MADISQFNDWSIALYELTEACEERTSLYFSDVAIQSADDLINPEAEKFNSKLTLANELPSGWVVETLGVISDGGFDGDIADLARHDVVIKPISGTQGDSVAFVEAGVLSALLDEGQVPENVKAVVTRHYPCHGYAQAIKPDSSNTIRMLTYVDDAGRAHLVCAVHKWATVFSGFIDNWSKGGVTTWIANGIMMGTMEDFSPPDVRPYYHYAESREPRNQAPFRYRNHPETGALISGKTIPYWAEAEKMVLTASEKIAPGVRYAGWDVMITPNGPILIEANPWPGVQLIQVHAPLLGDTRFREFLESYGVEGL